MSNPKVISHQRFVCQSIVERIRTLVLKEEAQIYSSTIEVALAELVREQMVTLARRHVSDSSQPNLLEQAIRLTETNLLERLNHYFDFEPYFEMVREKMKTSAQEITKLQEQLKEARFQERIGFSERIDDDVAVPFEIVEIGLRDALEGLVAIPLAEQGCYLNLEEIKNSYEVEGAQFPFQIATENFVFIIDDDGRIFVSTDNFSNSLIEDARGMLTHLARRLYVVT